MSTTPTRAWSKPATITRVVPSKEYAFYDETGHTISVRLITGRTDEIRDQRAQRTATSLGAASWARL